MTQAQIMMASFCLLVVISCVLGSAQTWRPQGRFGKRLSPDSAPGSVETWRPQGKFGKILSPVSSADDSAVPAPFFGLSRSRQIPIEGLFSPKEIRQFQSKPIFCSLTGLKEYPICDFLTSAAIRELEEWGLLFDA